MIGQHAKEERFVAVVERVEVDVLLEIRFLAVEVFQHARHLLRLRVDVMGEQSTEAERFALRLGEGGALVERRVAQQRRAARKPGRNGAWGRGHAFSVPRPPG